MSHDNGAHSGGGEVHIGCSHRYLVGAMRRMVAAAVLLSLFLVATGCGREPPTVEHIPLTAERTAVVNDLTIHYFDFNPDAAGTPVLFLHGYSGSAYEAYFFQDDLGDDVRVMAPDLPGLGRSDKPRVEYNLSFYLNFLRDFVRQLGLERFVLAGHSMGGKIAGAYTALHGVAGIPRTVGDDAPGSTPTRLGIVERLVLLAPYGLDGEAGDIVEFLSNTGDLVDASFNLHNQTLIDVAVRLNVFHDSSRIPQDLVDYIAAATFYSENGVEALASITRNIIARDPIDWVLPEISVPTLVIWGEQDRVLNIRHADTFVTLIPDASLVRLADCGHMPHVEQQEMTADAMRAFIRGTNPRP